MIDIKGHHYLISKLTRAALWAGILIVGFLAFTSPDGADGASVWHSTNATWYGPGYYGHPFACGGQYSTATQGVAVNLRMIRCGTRLTIRRGSRTIRVRVIDYCPGCNGDTHALDLTARSAMDLCGCRRPHTMKVLWKRTSEYWIPR